jgi:aspartate-semialdehyde dehydrogenase
MISEGDFEGADVRFFSTSQVGVLGPEIPGREKGQLLDAYSLDELAKCAVVMSAQGGDYTKQVYPALRAQGWGGYWIDAASALRMSDESCIILDPVNRDVIDRALQSGIRTFVGGNCTVSLLLMALAPLFKANIVEWVSSMTYQAASGAGARQMEELLRQSMRCTEALQGEFTALEAEQQVRNAMRDATLPLTALGAPLAFSVLPFIDIPMEDGRSREEWKGEVELNRILDLEQRVAVDGVCVRVPELRSHSQAFLLKLKKECGDAQEFSENAIRDCYFLYLNYTDIFNKIKRDESDIAILFQFLDVLQKIEEGSLDQHEASFEVGTLLKKMYVDSALKKADKLNESRPEPVYLSGSSITWKQFKNKK